MDSRSSHKNLSEDDKHHWHKHKQWISLWVWAFYHWDNVSRLFTHNQEQVGSTHPKNVCQQSHLPRYRENIQTQHLLYILLFLLKTSSWWLDDKNKASNPKNQLWANRLLPSKGRWKLAILMESTGTAHVCSIFPEHPFNVPFWWVFACVCVFTNEALVKDTCF